MDFKAFLHRYYNVSGAIQRGQKYMDKRTLNASMSLGFWTE